MPEAAKHWTGCKNGQFSQCGGPDDCSCNDSDDRLVWYDCKEGSYALCEDDNDCTDSSQALPPHTLPQRLHNPALAGNDALTQLGQR